MQEAGWAEFNSRGAPKGLWCKRDFSIAEVLFPGVPKEQVASAYHAEDADGETKRLMD